ncbi:hypothetical protein BC830DRAFT_1125154 [Chytriomyces sp. MP71]|nr:hypothetical protein BC830DRAFT_1125154 [Chytriomyces sp. MP71]
MGAPGNRDWTRARGIPHHATNAISNSRNSNHGKKTNRSNMTAASAGKEATADTLTSDYIASQHKAVEEMHTEAQLILNKFRTQAGGLLPYPDKPLPSTSSDMTALAHQTVSGHARIVQAGVAGLTIHARNNAALVEMAMQDSDAVAEELVELTRDSICRQVAEQEVARMAARMEASEALCGVLLGGYHNRQSEYEKDVLAVVDATLRSERHTIKLVVDRFDENFRALRPLFDGTKQ